MPKWENHKGRVAQLTLTMCPVCEVSCMSCLSTQKSFPTEVFSRSFHKSFHADIFSLRSLSAHNSFHTQLFPSSSLSTEKSSHKEVFTHRSLFTQNSFHADFSFSILFTQKSYTRMWFHSEVLIRHPISMAPWEHL